MDRSRKGSWTAFQGTRLNKKDVDVKLSVSTRLHFACVALVLAPPFLAVAETSTDYDRLSKIVKLPAPVSVAVDGSVKIDATKWKVEKEADGTEILTLKKNSDSKVAALKTKEGLESFTYFSLKKAVKGSDIKPEDSGSLLFEKGKLTSFTMCEDQAGKDSIGRVCVTATPKLCQTLRKHEPVGPEILKEMDLAEMRSLAIILTLRGSDHQLDNVVRFGNRLGLKSPLQTTKGQLITLARQIAKETGAATETRDPAAASKEDAVARVQLERAIPRLRQACDESGFLADILG